MILFGNAMIHGESLLTSWTRYRHDQNRKRAGIGKIVYFKLTLRARHRTIGRNTLASAVGLPLGFAITPLRQSSVVSEPKPRRNEIRANGAVAQSLPIALMRHHKRKAHDGRGARLDRTGLWPYSSRQRDACGLCLPASSSYCLKFHR